MKRREDRIGWKALIAIQRIALIVTGAGTALIVAGACILRMFNINFSGFEELLVMVAFWLYMVGCAHGSFEKSQITADILAVMGKGLFKEILSLCRAVLTAALCAVFFVWTVQLLLWAIEIDTRTPVYRIPMAFGYGSMVFGMGLSTFYHIVYMIDDIRAFGARCAAGLAGKGGAV
ncbi:MAG: TRAP transporter small permease subunit [Clostridiales Family XIII bacterium]|nr:TRAP transporter small permease subunit [Clostridiales Family XIII bacterium]